MCGSKPDNILSPKFFILNLNLNTKMTTTKKWMVQHLNNNKCIYMYIYVDDKNDSDDGEDEEGKRYY